MISYPILLLFTAFFRASTANVDDYKFSLFLDNEETFQLQWKVDKREGWIEFQAIVKTLGWIGIGFSPNGQMSGSDIIIGWVNNDQAFLQDRFARGRYLPVKDDVQNVELISGREEDSVTVLTFRRSITACEANDSDIETGSTRLIWAYHSEDPDPEGLRFEKHDKKGSRSLHLLADHVDFQQRKLGNDVQTLDIVNNQTVIRGDKDIAHMCSVFKLPKSEMEYYIVKFDKIVERGHEELVYHIFVYECRPTSEVHVNVSFDCSQKKNERNSIPMCRLGAPIASWANGERAVTFPEDVGYYISGSNGTRFVLMEIRYNNSKRKQGIVDSSGMRLWYTEKKPRFIAAILEVGSDVTPLSPFIAPGMKKFVSRGVCSSECTNEGLPRQGIHVLASLLNAHTAARSIRLRHFQRGVEQPEIDKNDNFDFNRQDMVFLRREIEIQQGDTLQLECQYDTSRRNIFTYGGYDSDNEMCLAYLLVYPAPRLRQCKSKQMAAAKQFLRTAKSNDWIQNRTDLRSERLASLMSDPKFKQAYWKLVNTTKVSPVCKDRTNTRIGKGQLTQSRPASSWTTRARYPKYCNVLVKPTSTGANSSSNNSRHSGDDEKNGSDASLGSYKVSMAALVVTAAVMLDSLQYQ